VLQTLVSCTGSLGDPIRNIQFSGLSFAHATWLWPSSTNGFPEVQANFFWNTANSGNTVFGAVEGWTPGNIEVKTGHNLLFERCVFKHLGAIGLVLDGGSQSNTIEGCVFTDISGTCIRIGNSSNPDRPDVRARDSGNSVLNCYVHDSPCEYHGGTGIFCGYTSGTLISHNEVANTPYSAISLGWGWGYVSSYMSSNRVKNNYITDFVQGACHCRRDNSQHELRQNDV
jgi:hypothetical protein